MHAAGKAGDRGGGELPWAPGSAEFLLGIVSVNLCHVPMRECSFGRPAWRRYYLPKWIPLNTGSSTGAAFPQAEAGVASALMK